MDYDLYHDESKEGGYWHGMLLIPCNKRKSFLNFLKEIRGITKYTHPVCFKGLNSRGNKFDCNRAWLSLGTNALMQYFKNETTSVLVNETKKYVKSVGVKTSYREILKIDSDKKIIGAKFILFKDRDNHKKMGDYYSDHAAKIETTFSIGLKGGLHWLGDDNNPINIKSIHFDGYEHYRRKINKARVIGRIKGLRDYCSIEENIEDATSDHTKGNCQKYEDCQFLQLTDLLVGGFRTILGEEKNLIQGEISFPLRELVNKWKGGYKRMQNSRWYKGFWLSECWIEDGDWKFGDFKISNNKQLNTLF